MFWERFQRTSARRAGEVADSDDPVTVMRERCIRCGKCIQVCPTGALAPYHGSIKLVKPEACIVCGACEPVCPTDTLHVRKTPRA